jgi:acyl carrier protein
VNDARLRELVVARLLDVAPEASAADIDPAAPIQEQLDIDSMDFLDFLTALAEETGIEVPERDYALVATVDGCVSYLSERLAVA